MVNKDNFILDQLSYNIIYIMPFQLQISYCNGIQIIDINFWLAWNILNNVFQAILLLFFIYGYKLKLLHGYGYTCLFKGFSRSYNFSNNKDKSICGF